jgi:hypothetical protein
VASYPIIAVEMKERTYIKVGEVGQRNKSQTDKRKYVFCRLHSNQLGVTFHIYKVGALSGFVMVQKVGDFVSSII